MERDDIHSVHRSNAPLWARSAPKIFNTVVDALHCYLQQSGIPFSYHYLDDLALNGPLIGLLNHGAIQQVFSQTNDRSTPCCPSHSGNHQIEHTIAFLLCVVEHIYMGLKRYILPSSSLPPPHGISHYQCFWLVGL